MQTNAIIVLPQTESSSVPGVMVAAVVAGITVCVLSVVLVVVMAWCSVRCWLHRAAAAKQAFPLASPLAGEQGLCSPGLCSPLDNLDKGALVGAGVGGGKRPSYCYISDVSQTEVWPHRFTYRLHRFSNTVDAG